MMGKRGVQPRPWHERIDGKYRIDLGTGCWLWTGAHNSAGYAQIGVLDDGGRPRTAYVHRLMAELHLGPIPDGMVVDHACNTPSCVNPEHLQFLTHRQNIMRSPHPMILRLWLNVCQRGHDMSDPANVYIRPDNGGRQCKECVRLRGRGAHKVTSSNAA